MANKARFAVRKFGVKNEKNLSPAQERQQTIKSFLFSWDEKNERFDEFIISFNPVEWVLLWENYFDRERRNANASGGMIHRKVGLIRERATEGDTGSCRRRKQRS